MLFIPDATTKINFTVYGIPVPQGSKTPGKARNGQVFVRDANDKVLRPWRQQMAAIIAEMAERHGRLDGPTKLLAVYRFPMPATRPKWHRFHEMPKFTAPDLDKLDRALGDALQAGGLIANDAQIADSHTRKCEVWGAWTGVYVELEPIEIKR